jgi:hypothetical protein
MKRIVLSAMRTIQNKSELVKSFFQLPDTINTTEITWFTIGNFRGD